MNESIVFNQHHPSFCGGTVTLTGESLTFAEINRVINDDQVRIAISDASVEKVRRARKALELMVEQGKEVYGTTTLFCGNKDVQMPDDVTELSIDMLASHATRFNGLTDKREVYSSGVTRAAWVILLNSFMKATSPASVDLVREMKAWANRAWDKEDPEQIWEYQPVIERVSIAFADMNTQAHFCQQTLCQRSLLPPNEKDSQSKNGPSVGTNNLINQSNNKNETLVKKPSPYKFKTGEVLALMSTNAFTKADTARIFASLDKLISFCHYSIALDMEADRCNVDVISFSAQVAAAQWKIKANVMTKLRYYLAGSKIHEVEPSSVHPCVSLRGAPDVIATCIEALEKAKAVLEDLANGHQGNPFVAGPWLDIGIKEPSAGPVCNFDITRLFCAMSYVQQAFSCLLTTMVLRGEWFLNNYGKSVGDIWSRNLVVLLDDAYREANLGCQVISSSMGRMNYAKLYDWSPPLPNVCRRMDTMLQHTRQLCVVQSLISAAVLESHWKTKAEDISPNLRPFYEVFLKDSIVGKAPNEVLCLDKLQEDLQDYF